MGNKEAMYAGMHDFGMKFCAIRMAPTISLAPSSLTSPCRQAGRTPAAGKKIARNFT